MSNELENVKSADQKYCSACAKLIHISADSCPFCGAKQGQLAPPTQYNQSQVQQVKAADQKFCSACGNVLHYSAEVCSRCGAKQVVAGAVGTKSKVVAGVFGILLGGIGIHKFYLGRVGWGIFYLIFCWTFIPAIVGFIEGIRYLVMDENKFHEKVRLGII